MRKEPNYQVLKASSIAQLDTQVNKYLSSGFTLMGGVSTVSATFDANGDFKAEGKPGIMFTQAVYREDTR